MNSNKKPIKLIVSVTLILLIHSIFDYCYLNFKSPFSPVNIISDIIKKNSAPSNNIISNIQSDNSNININNFNKAHVINNYTKKDSCNYISKLLKKIEKIMKNHKGKIRIAWLGDSMIEGDLITSTIRDNFQKLSNSFGVGFVPIQSITSKFRNTVTHNWKGEWMKASFKDNNLKAPLFLSGSCYYGSNGEVNYMDNTTKDSTNKNPYLKYLLCGYSQDSFDVLVNNSTKKLYADKIFNSILLEKDNSNKINLAIQNNNVPIYGVSIESEDGIIIDNLSFRGITGLELSQIQSNLLSSIDSQQYYDLIVIQYGVNLLFRPNDLNYDWYYNKMNECLSKVKAAMPNTDFLLIGTGDRAFCYNGKWESAKGINNLVYAQAQLAYNNKMYFYNLYSSMGGEGSIVNWANMNPSLANKDYVHPNYRGAKVIGDFLYNDISKIHK
jgi:lysophospholipase L1-like esterase